MCQRVDKPLTAEEEAFELAKPFGKYIFRGHPHPISTGPSVYVGVLNRQKQSPEGVY